MMCYRGGGVGHKSTRDATDKFLIDQDVLNIPTAADKDTVRQTWTITMERKWRILRFWMGRLDSLASLEKISGQVMKGMNQMTWRRMTMIWKMMKTQMRPNWRRNLITEGEDGNETEDNEEEDGEDDDALGPEDGDEEDDKDLGYADL